MQPADTIVVIQGAVTGRLGAERVSCCEKRCIAWPPAEKRVPILYDPRQCCANGVRDALIEAVTDLAGRLSRQ